MNAGGNGGLTPRKPRHIKSRNYKARPRGETPHPLMSRANAGTAARVVRGTGGARRRAAAAVPTSIVPNAMMSALDKYESMVSNRRQPDSDDLTR